MEAQAEVGQIWQHRQTPALKFIVRRLGSQTAVGEEWVAGSVLDRTERNRRYSELGRWWYLDSETTDPAVDGGPATKRKRRM